MNKDLMMKAAIQFKGVWPDDGYGLIVAIPSDIVLGNEEKDGSVSYVSKGVTENTFLRSWSHCTRKQFEDFVESLFDDAPEGATHYSPEDKNNEQAWWKLVGDEMLCICETGGIYIWECGHFDKTIQLIPRPAKKAPIIGDTPEQLKEGVKPKEPYMPKVGERCSILEDYILCGSTPLKIKKGDTVIVKAIVDLGYGEIALITDESILGSGTIIFSQLQKIKTEREIFIEQATKDYLDQLGSDAVNAKWFGRIFGVMYDAGYRKGAAK